MKQIIKLLAASCFGMVIWLSACKSVGTDSSTLQTKEIQPFNPWIDITCDVYCTIKYDPRAKENTKIEEYVACIGTKDQCVKHISNPTRNDSIRIKESSTTLSKDSQGFLKGTIYKNDSSATCMYLIGVRGKNDVVVKGYSMPGQNCLDL